MARKKIEVEITRAIAIGGKIISPGKGEASRVTVEESFAKNLLHRRCAKLAERSIEPGGGYYFDMSLPELRAEAKERKIKGAGSMGKPELINALEDLDKE